MKKTLTTGVAWVFFFIFLAFVGRVGAEEVAKADLYPRGARLTFEIPSGGSALLCLPACIAPDSLRYEVAGSAHVLSFSVQEEPSPLGIPPALLSLAQRVHEERARLETLEAQKNALLQSQSQLQRYVPHSAKELETTLSILQKRRVDIERQLMETSNRIQLQSRTLSILENQLQGQLPQKSDRILKLSLISSGKGNILVSGWVNEASWKPRYRVDLDTATSTVGVDMQIEASQKSGLDWNSPIVFHSILPQEEQTVLDLPPLVVDLASHNPPRLFAKALALAGDSQLESGAQRTESDTDLLFSSKGPLNGNGTTRRFNVESTRLKGTLRFVCIPQLQKEASILCETDPLLKTLPEGEADLLVDGSQTGKTSLARTAKGEALAIPFGKTPLLWATRRELLSKTSSANRGRKEIEEGYEISVKNGLPHAASVRIIDRIPISANETITVKLVSSDPKPTSIDSQTGHLLWDLVLNPGEVRKILVKTRTTFPADAELSYR